MKTESSVKSNQEISDDLNLKKMLDDVVNTQQSQAVDAQSTENPEESEDPMVNEAFEHLKGIFLRNFHNAMIEAGNYIIVHFYEGDYKAALAKNKTKDQPPNLKALIDKIRRAPKATESGVPSIGWFYNAVNLAAHEEIFTQEGLQTFGMLGHSHKLQLLHTPKLKSIQVDEIEEATRSAFEEKERLAKHAYENALSVRDFKKYINEQYPSGGIDLTALPPIAELVKRNPKELQHLWKKASNKLEDLNKLVGIYRKAVKNLEKVLPKKGKLPTKGKIGQAKKKSYDWQKAPIITDSGVMKDVSAPVIISATRRSDIPACYKVLESRKKTDTKKTVIFHDKLGTALTKQKEIDSHNFPFTLNTGIGCHFGCQYCYVKGHPFNLHAIFPVEAKVKLWIADKLDKELEKYKHLPQHLKRVQVNPATEGYLPLVMIKVKKELKRDIMAEALQVFRNHWENGNKWMVHLITKSHMIHKHFDIIRDMRDQVQLEITITTLDENQRRKMEGWAPSVSLRLKMIEKFASGGVFVRAMCMPLIGDRQDAEAIRDACFDNGARAFKHKGVNYWDESALLAGETKRIKGREDEVFEDLLVKSGEPYLVDGKIQKVNAMMPVIVKSGKQKRWMGYKLANFRNRNMVIVDSGYSDINDIDWGYVK